MTNASPVLLGPGAGEVLELGGVRIAFRGATPRQFAADYTAPAGFAGPPLHVHPGFDELFLVTAGELTVRTGAGVRVLGAGDSVLVPGDLPHTFANQTDAPVGFLLVCTPGGWEDYFRATVAGDAAAAAAVGERLGYAPAV